MNIIIIGTNLKRLKKIENQLKDDEFNIFLTKSTLEALDIIKGANIKAVICDHRIQISNVLNFPSWIASETGVLPPYFILSNKLTKKDIDCHENAQKVTGHFKDLDKIKELRSILKEQEELQSI